MKERILRELANLSNGAESKYLDLLKEFGVEHVIRRKATAILKLILHDYSRFSVMTIDSFFQKVIRSFAREIRLNASFRTEIDNRQALEEAVDLLFQEIESNDLLMSWMIMFLEENLEEGRSWDFRRELLKFGKEIEKEAFKVHGDELLETLAGKEQLSSYVAEMKMIISDAELRLKEFGAAGLKLIAAYGLSYDQFKGSKNSFANIFNKLATGKCGSPTATMLGAVDRLDNWFKKTDSLQFKSQVEKLYDAGLNQRLKESIEALSDETHKINSAQAILKNIYPFGLLGNIALKLKEVLQENNTVLLSDSGRMIGRIIEGNDTPFIYEKVGMMYRHFMLDEFQDTSRQQWMNFRPLVDNALASGNASLVVGDVKQSIYRWRNGDWNLLANQLEADLRHQNVHKETLDINWRSKKNIVDFNNFLFYRASNYLNSWFEDELKDKPFSEMNGVILQAYADQYQHCAQNDGHKGYVRVSFVDSEGATKKSEFKEKALMMLIEQLEEVQRSGVKPEQITILVRENADAELIAKALWEKKKMDSQPGCIYDVITSDTLKIGQSPVVRFVVNFFKIYARKNPQLIRAEILYGYYRILLPMMALEEEGLNIDLHNLFGSDAALPELFEKWLQIDPQSEFLSGLLALPLFELAVAIADHFQLGDIKGEKVYLQAFLDLVLEFGREDNGGISGFVEWWENFGYTKTLNLPNIKNFVRISTIHQSKGLEFDTVLIPFCNWEIALNSSKLPYLWSIPEMVPFNHLKMVLLKCDKSLKDSIFSNEYFHELLMSTMDNLNLLYVAMTRAISNLFIVMPYKDELKQPSNVAELMQNLMENPMMLDSIDQQKYVDFGEGWDPFNKIYVSGKMATSEVSLVSPRVESPYDRLTLNSNNQRMQIRLHSKDYFQITGNHRGERINRGTLMHKIFEKIKIVQDIEPAIRKMISSGELGIREGREFAEKIGALLMQYPFSDWFSDNWKVLNERDILRPAESKHRPDRVLIRESSVVVIDYKTGEKSDKDIRQMKGYLVDLKKMGYASGEGNIWYLQDNELVKVEMA